MSERGKDPWSPGAAGSSARTSSSACFGTATRCACSTTSPPDIARTWPTSLDEIELVEGDIQSYERVHNAVRGCELVFHQAALPSVPRSIQDPLTSNASTSSGPSTCCWLPGTRGCGGWSSPPPRRVYGAQRETAEARGHAALPIAPYAVAKLAGEGYCRAFTHVYGLETVALRYFNVFGPAPGPASQYAAVIPMFITAFLDGQRPVVYGDGEQSRDFTYIDNAVEATLLAAEAEGVAGETFNVACGEARL